MSLYGGYFAEDFGLDPSGTTTKTDCEEVVKKINNYIAAFKSSLPGHRFPEGTTPPKYPDLPLDDIYVPGDNAHYKDDPRSIKIIKRLKTIIDNTTKSMLVHIQCINCQVPEDNTEKAKKMMSGLPPEGARAQYRHKDYRIQICYNRCEDLTALYTSLMHEFIHAYDMNTKRPLPFDPKLEQFNQTSMTHKVYMELRAYYHANLLRNNELIRAAVRSAGGDLSRIEEFKKAIEDKGLIELIKKDTAGL